MQKIHITLTSYEQIYVNYELILSDDTVPSRVFSQIHSLKQFGETLI